MGDRRVKQLRDNVEEALRALEMASRAVQLAMECEDMARETLRRARIELREQRVLEQREREQVKAKPRVDPGMAKNRGGPPAKPTRRSVSVADLQSRGLWKPNPVETSRGGRYHLVKDEPPKAPLARLSHDEAHDLWSN